MNVCLVVDSNLKTVNIGVRTQRIKPYIRTNGQIYCTYVIDNKSPSWPRMDEIRERRYTEIIIALGINHCKVGEDNQGRAILELIEIYRRYLREIPGIRIYHVMVPPSLSIRINGNIDRFNKTMALMLQSIPQIVIVTMPPVLYAESGLLCENYARSNEKLPGFPDRKKLHLNAEGVIKIVYRIIRAISITTGKRIR